MRLMFVKCTIFVMMPRCMLRTECRILRACIRTAAVQQRCNGHADAASNPQGVSTDNLLPVVLKAVESVEREGGGALRVALHLEPYPGQLHLHAV